MNSRDGYINILMDVLRNNVHSVEDLVKLLGIEIEDILDRFEDKVYDSRKTILSDFGPVDEEYFNERDSDGDDEEREPWGFHMVPEEE